LILEFLQTTAATLATTIAGNTGPLTSVSC
jgi:hypothetical protein